MAKFGRSRCSPGTRALLAGAVALATVFDSKTWLAPPVGSLASRRSSSRVARPALPAVLQRLIGRFRHEEDPVKKMEHAMRDMLKEQKKKREALARMKSTQDRVREQFREAQQSVAEWHRRAVVASKDNNQRSVKRAEAQRDIANGLTDRLQEQIVEVEKNMEAMTASLLALGLKIQATREEQHHLRIQMEQSAEASLLQEDREAKAEASGGAHGEEAAEDGAHGREVAKGSLHRNGVASNNVHSQKMASDDLHTNEAANNNVHRNELASNINLHSKDVQMGTAEGHLEEIDARLLDVK